MAGIHGGAIEHCDEAVAGLDFIEAFECGDELFETLFDAADGVGANVGDGGRFTRVPRADLTGPGEWATHVPARATGPNAASCIACHQGAAIGGAGDASGPEVVNVVPVFSKPSAVPGYFDAILEHGGEAEASRVAFASLAQRDAAKVVRFLDNLVLFFPEEEAAPAVSEPAPQPDTSGDRDRDRRRPR